MLCVPRVAQVVKYILDAAAVFQPSASRREKCPLAVTRDTREPRCANICFFGQTLPERESNGRVNKGRRNWCQVELFIPARLYLSGPVREPARVT